MTLWLWLATMLVVATLWTLSGPWVRRFLEEWRATNGQLARIGSALWCVSDELKRIGAEHKRQYTDSIERNERAARAFQERLEREKREANRPTSNESVAPAARELLDKMADTARGPR